VSRRAGVLQADDHVGVSDHACWGYASDAERGDLACAWLADGLRRGQRGLYVADATASTLVDELAGIPDAAAWISSGGLVVLPSTDAYDLRAPIDADAQLAMYAGAVDQAIADGYDGVRVAADITPLVADVRRRPAHLRWEQIADRYIAEHPLAPLCLSDTRTITGIDAIVCVHPLQGPVAAPFSVHGVGAEQAALRGELDAFSSDLVAEVLDSLPGTDHRLDVSALEFVDARAAWVLQHELRRRRETGRPVVLAGVAPRLRRVWEACRFDATLLDA
jgi:anti-anti-sigma factor